MHRTHHTHTTHRFSLVSLAAALALALAAALVPARALAAGTSEQDSDSVASVTTDGTTTYYDDLQDAADAATAGSVITLLSDVTLDDDTGIAIVNKGTESSRVTFDLAGHTLTGNNAGSGTGTSYYYDADGTNATAGILQVVGSYVTLTDTSTGTTRGTISNTNTSSTSYAAVAVMLTYDVDNKGTTSDLVIEGGVNVSSSGTASSRYQAAVYLYGASGKVTSKLTVSDATLTGPFAVSTYSTSTSYFSVVIEGGTFVTTQHAGSSYGAVYATSSTYAAVYDISGGTFNAWCYYNREALAEGCVVLVAEETDEDGTGTGTYLYTVTDEVPASYLASLTLSGDETPTYYQVSGNLYGLQLALDKSTASSYGYPSGGKTSVYFAGTGATITVVADATYTMASGDFLGPLSGTTVYFTFEVAEGATLSGSIALGVAQLTITGEGTATDFTVTAVTSYGTGTYAGTTSDLALDATEVDSSTGLGTYYGYLADAAALVTYADGSKAYFTSGPSAIIKAAVNEGSTVTLLQDVSTANASISVSKSFTLDLNGHTLTLTRTSDTSSILTISGADAEVLITDTSEEGGGTIKDTGSASLTNKSMFYIYGANSSLTLTNVTIQMYGAASSGYNEVVYADTTSSKGSPTVVLGEGLTIEELEGTGSGWLIGVAIFGYYDTNEVDSIADDYAGTTVQVLDGAKVTVSGPAIMGEGTTHGTTVEVSGGTLTSTEGTAIYLPAYGTTTISGGTVTGLLSGIEVRAGTLTVTGGTITGTSTSFAAANNGSGTTIEGAGIAVSQHSTNLDLSVTVTGGTITGYYGLYEADLMDSSSSNISLLITGGSFFSTGVDIVAASSGSSDDEASASALDEGTSTASDEEEDETTYSTGTASDPAALYSQDCTYFAYEGATFSTDIKDTYPVEEYSTAAVTATDEDGDEYTYYVITSDYEAEYTTYDTSTGTRTTAKDTLVNAFAKVIEDGGTVTLLKDIEVTSQIQTSKTVTLDLNGYTLTLTGSYTRQLYVASGGDLTICDSSEAGTGTVTNAGSTVSYGLIDVRTGASLTIESGTFEDVACAFGSLIRGRSDSTITISGGSFSCTGYNQVKPSCNTGENRVINGTGCTLTITGGTFSTQAGYLGAIYCDKSSTVSVSDATITTLMTSGIEVSGGTLTVENTTIIVSKVNTYSTSSGFLSTAVALGDNATATIESGTYTAPYAVYVMSSGGNVTINGGTFTQNADGYAVLAADADVSSSSTGTEGSAIVVTDGIFNGSLSISTATSETNSSVVGEASLTVSGGWFTSAVDQDYCAEGYAPYTTATGTGDAEGMYTVGTAVASVSTTTTSTDDDGTETTTTTVTGYYADLDEAIDAASSGDTVTLLQDLTYSGTLLVSSTDLTLDLGGFTLTFDTLYYTSALWLYNSDVTITNGTIVDARCESATYSSELQTIHVAYGDLVLDGVTVEAYAPISTSSSVYYNYVVYVYNGNETVTITNSTIAELTDDTEREGLLVGVCVMGYYSTSSYSTSYSGNSSYYVATLDVTDSTIETSGYCITGNGSWHNTDITVTDSTLISGSTAIYHPQYGTLTITQTDSGTTYIEGAGEGIEMRAGVLTVTGGTIVATGEPGDSTSNGSGTSVYGAAVAVSQHTTNLPVSVTITGGTFQGYYALYEEDTTGDGDTSGITLALSGGTFYSTDETGTVPAIYSADCTGFVSPGTYASTAIDETYCASGYEPSDVITSTGLYTVIPYVVPNDLTVVYDGSTHSVSVTTSDTTGATTVSYEYAGTTSTSAPSFTDAGTYEVTYVVTCTSEENGTATATGTYTVTIQQVETSVTLNDVTVSYGTSYSQTATLSISGPDGVSESLTLPEGAAATVTYYTDVNCTTAWEASDGETTPTAAGTYYAKATYAGTTNFSASEAVATLTIQAASISFATTSYSGTYDGAPHGITVTTTTTTTGATVTYATSESGEYSTTNPTYTDAGTYTVYYQIVAASHGTVTGSSTVTIAAATPTVTLADVSVSYGDEYSVAATVMGVDGTELTGATVTYAYYTDAACTTEWEASGTETLPADVGTYYVVASVAASGNYAAASTTATITIAAASTTVSLSDLTVTYGTSYAPTATVSAGTTTLTDATVTYAYFSDADCEYKLASAPTDAGTYYVRASYAGSDSYAASEAVATLTIQAASIASATVSCEGTLAWTGEALTPEVTVTLNGTTLIEGTDYTLSYADNTDPGTATVTVTGTGNYAGTATTTFTIAKYVASVTTDGGETYTYYTSLSDAIKAARGTEGETTTTVGVVTVLQDCTLATASGAGLKVFGDLTLDLNGHTVTVGITANWALFPQAGSSVTITDTSASGGGTVTLSTDAQYGLVYTSASCSVELSNVAVTNVPAGVAVIGLCNTSVSDEVSVTLTDVTVKGAGTVVTQYSTYDGTLCAVTLDLDVTGGSFTSTSSFGFDFEGMLGSESALDLTGTTVTSYFWCVNNQGATMTLADCTLTVTGPSSSDSTSSYYFTAVATTNGGTTTITSGTYTAPYAAYVFSSGGTVSISGGTFVGSTAALKADADSYDNGTDSEGSTFVVTGGTFKGAVDISEATGSAGDAEGQISGGWFTYQVAEKDCAEGYKPYAQATGTGDVAGMYTVGIFVAALDEDEYTYTGSAVALELTVTLDGAEDEDYDLLYYDAEGTKLESAPTDAGSYSVAVTSNSKSAFVGTSDTMDFSIVGKELTASMVSLSATTLTYTGATLVPTVTVTDGETTLVAGTDYVVYYDASESVDVGTYALTIEGLGNYAGSVSATYAITAATLAEGDVTVAEATYTGSALTPSVTVTSSATGETLVEDTDYTLSVNGTYTSAGTYEAAVTVTGCGNYTGTASASFTIAAAQIADQDISVDAGATYTGSALTPSVTVTSAATGEALMLGTDYTLAYADADGNAVDSIVSVGTYTVTVTGCGNYAGTFTATYVVSEASQGLSFASSEVTAHVGDSTATTNTLTCDVEGATITYASSDESVATVATDGTVTIVGAGTATITATATATGHATATASYVLTVSDHSYGGEPAWSWTGSETDGYTAATATFSCTTDGCTSTKVVSATVTSAVTTAAICTTDGTTTYTAQVALSDTIYTATQTATIAATGHTEGAAVTENVVEATCTTAGSYDTVTYCTVCGAELSRTTTTVDAMGHDYDWSDLEWTWSDDCTSATATVTCTNDASHTLTLTATVTSVTTDATEGDDGYVTHTATVSANGTTYTSVRVTSGDAATGHVFDLDDVEWTWSDDLTQAVARATCPADGAEIVASATTSAGIVTTTVAATCTTDGTVTATATVTLAGTTVSDTRSTTLAATGHTWGSPSWSWSADGSTATLTLTCESCGATTSAQASISSVSNADGTTTYTATATVDGVTYTSTMTDDEFDYVTVWRLYNQWTGEHLFTTDENEYEVLGSLGWTQEGVAWYAPTSGTPVWRLYNPYTGDHMYTTDENEYEVLGSLGWTQEDIAFYSAEATDASALAIYRLYNPYATAFYHHFSADLNEYTVLTGIGWTGEGVAFYGLDPESLGL